MKRIGIYGGTFDPPHVGHVRAAQHALCALKLDELLVVPAGISPGKDREELQVTATQRLEMTRLAMAKIPGVTVLDMELRRNGVSYTADTLVEIKTLYPDAKLHAKKTYRHAKDFYPIWKIQSMILTQKMLNL